MESAHFRCGKRQKLKANNHLNSQATINKTKKVQMSHLDGG